ncbi:ATP-dependent RNA helicase DDX35 [Sporothrix brasiliensis 5110]|uniref:RNA helicase n=1 Tax=Sporothrix brasiliensis 5110 TaxID=1398154 RepID=A0A0C2F870_9PEZI|nr:ATP-dependent RNA helicase DDX35 [Sporothrix brasiliensis 5110]KIH95249.1 ATP-dependent RNA helicase DDX35 [Sporothrix brasiliensis 5110]
MAELNLAAAFIPSLHKPAALLPIAKHRESLLYLVETYPVVIVVGQTGSGKTTQIPQFLEQAGWCADGKVIAITQPRRIAATTVAVRVAEEYGCDIGKEVGYSIRFEDVTSSMTRIKFMTDGLLIREALVDPLLSRYSVIMVDEAHERSISTDILLGLLRKIRRRRPELRIIVSSATLQAEDFLAYFSAHEETDGGDKPAKPKSGNATTIDAPTRAGEEDEEDENEDDNKRHETTGAIISLEGRTYPIDILYVDKPVEDYVEKAIGAVLQIHEEEPDGDILVFLTGREEIERAVQAVAEAVSTQDALSAKRALLPLPMYAGLTADEQMYVFDEAPEDTRKVIFATNIAEASVTISGVVYVVDSGFVKQRAYDPITGIETLTTTPVSKAAAAQRAGRGGRTKPGKCFRLYTEDSYLALPDANVPEIQRSNLAPVVLQLKALGIDNVLRFPYFTPPPTELMTKALELLYSLGALDDYAKLTKPLGLRMAELAVEPMMAKTLLAAPQFGCLGEMLTIAAMTSREGNSSVWIDSQDGGRSKEERQLVELVRRRFAADEGDHVTLLNVFQAFVTKGNGEAKFCKENRLNFQMLKRAVSVRAQLRRFMERFGFEIPDVRQPQSQQPHPSAANKAEQIRRCLTTGYFAHAARMQADGTFRNVAGGTVLHAHPSSLLFNRKADWVLFHEVMETGDKTYIRDITKIEKNWLLEYAPDFYQTTEQR